MSISVSNCGFHSVSMQEQFDSLLALSEHSFETKLFHQEEIQLPGDGTHFGFVWQGSAQLLRREQSEPLPIAAGMYFSISEPAILRGQQASGLVITHPTYRAQFQLGGPIESTGQFPYIDGGTTSLLIAPPMAGDPCLHALYMPPNVDQTMHHHPSDRIGIINKGSGQCCDENTCYDLLPGTLFIITADHKHRFVTGKQGLDLVVFHPDSDVGFSDRNHPMLNRTLVNNIRAADLPDIQTAL